MPASVSPWVVFTLLWLTLPVVTPVRRQYETATKSVISLNPPWTAFFQGETVTLTCYRYGFKLPQKTKWYQNGKALRETKVNTFKFYVSGEYQCQADDLHLSIPVSLHFYKGPLVLRAPPAVFEGQSVTLRCHAKESIAQNTLTFYKNDVALKPSGQRSELLIHHANQTDNGVYHCSRKKWHWSSTSSNSIRIQVQELFPRPVLRTRPSQPVDGSPVTLTCQTRLPAQKSNVQLQFCFFRNFQAQALGSGCSNSSELHIPAIWTEDSMSYWCMAETTDAQVRKRSLAIRIPVQRASADFQIHSVPALTSVFEGQLLLFNCSVKGVPGPIRFSWYKRDKLNKETKTPKSSEAEFKISAVNSSDAGDYYCEANNSRRSFLSKAVPVTIKVPVSQPVLTLSTGKTRALEGDLMTLHCRSRRGSPHIRYEFYYEDAFLEINSTLSGGGASFNFSMTTERSGNYYCTADNGLGAQRSEAVRISVIVPVSRPVLTLRVPGAQVVVGDVIELQCEALGGSPPILYHFYHQNVTLGSSSAPSGGRGSFNFSVTAEHSGNFSCEADNGQGPQRSDTLALSAIEHSRNFFREADNGRRAQHSKKVTFFSIPGKFLMLKPEGPEYMLQYTELMMADQEKCFSKTDTTKNRSVTVAAGIAGGLLIVAGAAAGVLFYRWFSRKAGGKPAFDDSRDPSFSEPQEPTYYNVPACLELQPVYSNDPKEEVIYTEVQTTQQNKHAVQKTENQTPKCQMAE